TVSSLDAHKQSAPARVADARAGLAALTAALAGWRADPGHAARAGRLVAEWAPVVERAYHLGHQPLPAQTEIIGVLSEELGPRDVVVQAAGSLPGDLQRLWRGPGPPPRPPPERA